MTRYFFQAQYRGATLTDYIGEEFSTVKEAQAHAACVAGELSRNSSETTVIVLSDDGKLLSIKG
jgi:Domain of unknown function (DUF6894)